jgi:hypothetical protein
MSGKMGHPDLIACAECGAMIYRGVVVCPKCNSRDFVMERCSVCNEPLKRREYFIGRPLHVRCAAALMGFDSAATCSLCNGQTVVDLARLTWDSEAGEPYAGHVVCSGCGKPNLLGWQYDWCAGCSLPILRCALPIRCGGWHRSSAKSSAKEAALQAGTIRYHSGCRGRAAKTTTGARASGSFGSVVLFLSAAVLTSVGLFEWFLR